MHKPDGAGLIDQEGHPAPAVLFFDRFIGIGDKRIFDPILSSKFRIRLQAIPTDTNYLSIQFFKLFQNTLEVIEFIGSDRGKGCKIQGQNDVFFPNVVS